jgi:hypothetical protein
LNATIPHLLRTRIFRQSSTPFLAAYRPVLEKKAGAGRIRATLIEEVLAHPPTCEEEINAAVAWFERFFNPDVAMRVLSPEGREILGNPDRWEWCYRRILCCLIFGWLVCRGPRAIRGFAYYVDQYWRCVRPPDAPR